MYIFVSNLTKPKPNQTKPNMFKSPRKVSNLPKLGWVWMSLVDFIRFDTFLGLLEHVLVWVWLGLVKFCKVFDIFLGLLEHVLVWVWLGLVRFG